MSESSGFFNAKVLEGGEYDRIYLAEDFAKYFASFVGNGVFAKKLNALQVVVDSGMNIKVRSGQAWINGYWYENNEDLKIEIATAPSVGQRVDGIFVRFDITNRSIYCYYGQGKSTVQRDSTYYDLMIAKINVQAGAVSLSQVNIVDTRGDTNACGYVAGLIQQIDTTEFFTQLNNWLTNYLATIDKEMSQYKQYLSQQKEGADGQLNVFEGDLDSLKNTATQEINALISQLQGLLDGDVASNLQLQINTKINKPTAEDSEQNNNNYLLNFESDESGDVDTNSVKYIKALNAGTGRVLMKKRGESNVVSYADFASTYLDSEGASKNPYEVDAESGTLGANTHYLVSGKFYGGPNCLVDAPTWELLQILNDWTLRYQPMIDTFELMFNGLFSYSRYAPKQIAVSPGGFKPVNLSSGPYIVGYFVKGDGEKYGSQYVYFGSHGAYEGLHTEPGSGNQDIVNITVSSDISGSNGIMIEAAKSNTDDLIVYIMKVDTDIYFQ